MVKNYLTKNFTFYTNFSHPFYYLGCIDFTFAANNGLANIVSLLDPIYQQYKSIISKADLWVLAANLAVQYASTAPSASAYRKLLYFLYLW